VQLARDPWEASRHQGGTTDSQQPAIHQLSLRPALS
jgi:hypothetical protein